MTDINAEIQRLPPDRRRLLELLLKREAAPPALPLTIPRRDGAGPVPLSFAQQRLWFLNQLEPDSSAYNVPAALRLEGRLSVETLERTLSEIVRRHEVLRTTFRVVDGRAEQVVRDAWSWDLLVADLSGWPQRLREAEARNRSLEEARRPFDLSQGIAMRATLLRLDETDHVVLLTLHHIVADGWSMGVLVREVAELYRAYGSGREPSLPELPIQYADFTLWERQLLQADALGPQLAYWKRQLGGPLPALELSSDGSRPAAPTGGGASLLFTLPSALMEALAALCREQKATLFMLLLAAYAALLYRYTGQEDILIGTPTANRKRAETEPLIGCFINTLVMRINLSGNPGFRELLGRVRETALAAFEHDGVPFERLVEELRPERGQSRQRIFQVWFVLQNAPMQALELPGLTLSDFGLLRETSQFDLALSMTEIDGQLTAALNYSTDKFDADTVAQMAEHFTVLLAEASADPEWPLLEIPLGADDPWGEAEGDEAGVFEADEHFVM
ncbi:MAG: condensation domain-containing protein [Acidobacteria bacterium]|nr:condensation domain-containing protein [Acidobacteriota bacterium]